MVRAILTMTVRPGSEREFERAWGRVADVARDAPGNRGQALLHDRREARTYLVVSDWDSAAAFAAFERSPEQDDLTAPLRALRETASMQVLDVLDGR
jgi:heme-degrading monooxygenase HmoA